MSKIIKPLRSASLIITRSKQSETSFYDYEILMMKKKARPPWGSHLVFPGGLYDKEHDTYLKEKFGFSSGLEATAIRECFEQAGLFFTEQPMMETEKLNELSKVRLQYIARCLDNNNDDYKQVSRDYIQKLGQIFKPKKRVLPFLRLITIPTLPHRYDTTFFLHRLQQYKFINFLKFSQHQKYIHESDQIVKCDNEFDKFRWMTPADILSEFFTKQLSLAPPQYMMVNTMMRFHKHMQLQEYLAEAYVDGDEFGNVSLGPNIVSLMPNNSVSREKPFKFAATLLGDHEFPFKKHLETETCSQLRDQFKKWQQNKDKYEHGRHRCLFNQSKEFFAEDYQVECDLKRSNLRKMMGFDETRGRLEKEVVL